MPDRAPFWTPQTDAWTRELWERGLPASKVARIVGAASPEAVIGRMWRLGVRRSPQVSRGNRRFAWRKIMQSPCQPRLVFEPPPVVTPVPCEPRPWLTREDGECAYPVSGDGRDVMSCCNRAARGGYCQAHRAAMFRPPRQAIRLSPAS